MGLSWLSITLITILLSSVYIRQRLRVRTSQLERDAEADKPGRLKFNDGLSQSARQLRTKLVAAIPHIVISPNNGTYFKLSTNAYWDQKACEAPPSCVLRPRNVWELAQAVKILKQEFDRRHMQAQNDGRSLEPVFAVRGGGHSPVVGASSIKGGVLVDVGLFNQVTPADDGKTVAIGAGCKWIDVSRALEKKGLAVAGGRNSAVGVAGLTLGGGLSFFSPRYGFVCSNIVEYEIVLADGSITTASEKSRPNLWRALKGGSNNFGIVTRFTARSFPCQNIWSGFLYLPPWQSSEVLSAFYSSVNRTIASSEKGSAYDEHASGPITCFTYLEQLGIQAIAINLVHTNPPTSSSTQWPSYWRTSAFSNLWRIWSTCQTRSLSSATDEMSVLNPPGRRQEFATTTIHNDLATLKGVHAAYRDAIGSIKKHGIKKMSWTLVLQPLLPEWLRKGDPNPLGLDVGTDIPLVNISFTVNWALEKDDEVVQGITRRAIEKIDRFAEKRGTAHRYRYLNYCAGWQKPFEGYGEGELEFLRGVSRDVDPEGLFQSGCTGVFKLDV